MKKFLALFLLALPLLSCCKKEETESDNLPTIELSTDKLVFTDDVKTNSFTLKSNAEIFWCFDEKALSPVYGAASARTTWFEVNPYCGGKGEYRIEVTAFDGTKNNSSTLNVVVDDKVVASLELVQQ